MVTLKWVGVEILLGACAVIELSAWDHGLYVRTVVASL